MTIPPDALNHLRRQREAASTRLVACKGSQVRRRVPST